MGIGDPVIVQCCHRKKAALKDNSHWGLDILIPEYLALVETLKAADTLGSRVKKAMLQLAQPALPGLDMVADTFNLTSRTLQRRLVQEGTSFRQIAEGLKRQVCHLLLLHDRYSVADISLLLGYSDAAAFIHSFKKWYGATPAKLRKQTPPASRGTATG